MMPNRLARAYSLVRENVSKEYFSEEKKSNKR